MCLDLRHVCICTKCVLHRKKNTDPYIDVAILLDKFINSHGTQETIPNKRALNMSQIFTTYATG